MRPQFDDSIVLVTGASAGIGQEFARQLAPRARVLVLLARRRDRLESLAAELHAAHPSLRIHLEAVDLTDRKALVTAMERIEREVGAIDVLINNAGFGSFGSFVDADFERMEQMIELNVRALAYLTHRVLPGMLAKGCGGILNVSSGLGMYFAPGFATYVGTKHFVSGFSESLRLEVAPRGVVVSHVCPGPVQSEFQAVAGMDAFGSLERVAMSAEACARDTLRRFEKGDALIVPGASVRVLYALGGLVPRAIVRKVLRPLARRFEQLGRGT